MNNLSVPTTTLTLVWIKGTVLIEETQRYAAA
jgi:hypothetical protein